MQKCYHWEASNNIPLMMKVSVFGTGYMRILAGKNFAFTAMGYASDTKEGLGYALSGVARS